jgi:hypothetical protein
MEDKHQPNPDYKTPWYLRVRRSDYTKRAWRRLRPKMIAAARRDGVNPAYLFATYEVWFVGADPSACRCGGLGYVDNGGTTPYCDKCPDCE